jgi:GxxExxY protein
MTRKEPDQPHLLERELTGQIIGAFYECYNILHYGFLEAAYRRALAVELRLRGHSCSEEGLVEVIYKGNPVGAYRYDLLVDERVIIEVKTGDALGATAKAQLLNYLRATNLEVGLLLHFGPEPNFHRCVHQRFSG